MATIKEVSQHARVSPSTVSRVLNGSAPVNADTKSRVLKAVEQLNYQPNAFARGLVTNRSGGIGVVINSLSSPFFSALLQGIENVIEKHNMHLLVANGRADKARELECIDYLSQRSDAVIGFFEALSVDDLVELSRTQALVVIGRNIIDIADRCVHLDNEHGGHLATNYLIDKGHKNIAHISGPLHLPDSRARLQGYRQALSEAGFDYDERLVYEGKFEEQSGQTAVERLLARSVDFTAIFAANDQSAAGALQTLRQHKLSVPDDISLIGYDDIFLCNFLTPTLTTVKQPLLEMGEAAARIALAQLEQSVEEVRYKFEPSLIERQSVKSISQY